MAKKSSEALTFKKNRLCGIDETVQDVFELVPLNDDLPTMYTERQHIEIISVMIEF
ncbi:hypothetical protein [Aeromonas caviae]|uniref:hypothetical protein n=1 Tax=Aeromonas caviae TaxID=648 RepID=UPI002B4A4780|nr:hypothetical protein [Aeromonas caviae]